MERRCKRNKHKLNNCTVKIRYAQKSECQNRRMDYDANGGNHAKIS